MRLAVLSDIHSNAVALRACLREAERFGVEGFLFLGDYVSDCADTCEVLQILDTLRRDAFCMFLRGNREEYMLAPGAWKRDSQTGSLLYTYERLTLQTLAWFGNLPITDVFRADGMPPVRLCHGSPVSAKEHLWPNSAVTHSRVLAIDEKILLCGHTHHADSTLTDTVWVHNAGTVGVPADGSPDADLLLLESDAGEWHVRRMRCAYDVEEEIRHIRDNGLYSYAPGWARTIAQMLRTGTVTTMPVLLAVARMKQETDGSVPEEELWTRALAELAIPDL